VVNDSQLRRILVAIDGSHHSNAAWRTALELARRFDAELIALHVAVPRSPAVGWMSPRAALRAQAVARHHGEQLLEEVRAAAAGAVPAAMELEFGDPADVICERAAARDVDLIVVGSRGLNLLERLLLGSVSSAVVERATCSVLVVRVPAEQTA
jgi:nucleotide-binding universal stress UspA family protein